MSLIGATVFFIMLCMPFFIHYPMNDNYLQLYPVSLGIGVMAVVALVFSFIKGNCFRPCLADYLFMAMVAYYILRYDYTLQLANWKIGFALLSLPLWFGSRIILSHRDVSRQWVLGSVVAVGCLVAVWGLLQLYGYVPSNHSLFAITGPFYNPGPYSGYVAVIFCVAMGCWLRAKGFLRYVWFLAMALMGCILPAGMSRSAWIAILVGGIWMLTIHYHWHKRLKTFFKEHPYKSMFATTALCICLCAAGYFMFQLKSDSAYGRLFIWKNTCTAISEAPLFGHGPGSFPMVYGKAQAEYFAKGDYTETEERVAGSPEYAFNEILQLWIEGGLLLVLLVGTFYLVVFQNGYMNRILGTCIALIAILCFSMFSYPLQILPCAILLVLIASICICNDTITKLPQKSTIILSFIFVCISLGGVYILKDTMKFSEYWYKSDILYANKAYKEASRGYSMLYKQFKHNPSFLFVYAKSLIIQKRYLKADSILQRLQMVSCNPMVFCLQGDNYQEMKDYQKAEEAYQQAVMLLPSRIYPYYLLAKLYSIPEYKDEEKMMEMRNIVLHKKPKVQSGAIEEMRNEITKSINLKY